MTPPSTETRRRRRAAARRLAEPQLGVLHRRQLYAHGWTRWQIAAELDAERWVERPNGVLVTHRGPLSDAAERWAAVLGAGPSAALAGVSALVAAGLTGVEQAVIDIVVPKSSRPRRSPRTRVRETRILCVDDIITAGIPRVRPAVAVIQAADWARSDREAALLVAAPVQQGLLPAAELPGVLARWRRHRRRALMDVVVADVVDGAQSLGEVDYAGLCRRRGLPVPTRQRVVTTPDGRCYLDVAWDDYDLSAEIDGSAHMAAASWLADSWRQNDVVIGGRHVLRFPLLGIRLDPERVMDQTEQALRRRGWRPERQHRPGWAVA